MDVRSVAGTFGGQDRGKDGALACPRGETARQFAQDDCLIGGAHADRRAYCDLVLAWPIFGQKGLRCHAGGPQRRDQACAEITLLAEGGQGVGTLRLLRHATVNKLLLETGQYLTARCFLQPLKGAAKKTPRAMWPGIAVF